MSQQPSAQQPATQQRSQQQEAVEATAKTATDPAIVAAGASVLLSWYEFFVQKNKVLGLFVAFWPPTILAFASYFNQTEPTQQLKQSR